MIGARRAGYVGVLPGRAGLVAEGLEDGTLQRWDRWFEMAAAQGLPVGLDPRRPAWRLVARAGLFAAEPVAGTFRLGRDRAGRTYPFAVLRLGAPPDTSDPWFDAAERIVRGATEGVLGAGSAARAVADLAPPARFAPPPEEAAVLWRDDWEVRELRLATGADLAAFPLRLAAEAGLEDAA